MKTLLVFLLLLLHKGNIPEEKFSELEQEIIIDNPSYPTWDKELQEKVQWIYTNRSYKK